MCKTYFVVGDVSLNVGYYLVRCYLERLSMQKLYLEFSVGRLFHNAFHVKKLNEAVSVREVSKFNFA